MCALTNITRGLLASTIIGRFEEATLMTMAELERPLSVREIRENLEHRLGAKVAIGKLYATLERLEDKDFVSSWEEGPTGAPGGRAKRVFGITAEGKNALVRADEFTRGIRRNTGKSDMAVTV